MTSTSATAAPIAGEAAEAERRTRRLIAFAIGLTLATLVLRLAMIGQFGLFFDEVYYWLWSTQLAGSYYDHPPMVALFIKLGTLLFGDNEFGVRFTGAVSVAIDAALIYGIAHTLTESRRVAAWAAILMNVTTLTAFSVVIVPDQPMMLFWLLGVYALAKIAKGGPGQWWLLAGLAAGLASASKFTTFFLVAAVPVWLLLVPSLRHWYRRAWPYLGLVAALAAFAPVLAWNAANDWVSFTLQYNREEFATAEFPSFLQYLSLFPLMITPPILLLAGAGAAALLRRGWRQDAARALLIIAPIPLALFFAYHSVGEWIGAHWIAPLGAIAVIYAAIGIDADWRGVWRKVMAFCRVVAVPVGLAVTVLFYLSLVETVLDISAPDDMTARFRGWPEFVANEEHAREQFGADYILGRDYSSPAYIRFYLDDPPPAFQIGDARRWSYFEGLGTADAALADGVGLYVGRWGVDAEYAFISQYFNRVERVGVEVIRPIRPGVDIEEPAWLVSDPKPAAMALFGLPPEAAGN